MKLLTQNSKLKKNPKYNTWGLDIAPHKLSGYNTCKFAGLCAEVCVGEHSGLNKMPNAKNAKIRKAKMFFEEKNKFLEDLHNDLEKLNVCKDKRKALVRTNVDSDIPWEKIDPSIYQYDNITFYDYTKYINRSLEYVSGDMPKNYHLTYSWNENSDVRTVNRVLQKGGCINMVLGLRYKPNDLCKIPKFAQIGTKKYSVVDGDLTDERIPENDGEGKVVVVRAKTRIDLIQHYTDKGFFVNVKNNKIKV